MNSNNLLTSYKFLRKEIYMKKNLIKILALSTLVLSIGACTGKSQTNPDNPDTPVNPDDPGDQVSEITLTDVFSLSGGHYVNEGKKVRVNSLQVYTEYEGKLLCGFGNAGSSYQHSQLKAFEVEPTEYPQWTAESGRGNNAEVNVIGDLVDYHGRPVLKNATVEIVGEGANSKYSGGIPYISGSYMDREYWNSNMGKGSSGASIEGTFQLASVPTAVSETESAEFYVVFTAENTNAEDPTNEYLIHCYIPSGLKETARNYWNTLFGSAHVDDFFLLSPFTMYDSTTGGMGLLLEDGVSANPSYSYKIPEDQCPVILKQFSDIKTKNDPKFKEAIPAIGCEEEGVFSYTVEDLFGYDVDTLFSDSSFILLADHSKVGTLSVSFNCGLAKSDAVFEAIGTKAVAAGYAKDTTITVGDGQAIYVKKDEGDNVVAEVYAAIPESGASVQVYFFANRATDEEVANMAAAVEKIDERAAALLEDDTFASLVPDFSSTYSSAVENVTVSWSFEETYAEDLYLYAYSIAPEFADDTFADDDAWEAFFDDYENQLETAGFESDFVVPGLQLFGAYFNETSGTLVTFDGVQNNEDHFIGMEMTVFVLSANCVGYTVFDCGATSQWTPNMARLYGQQLMNTIFQDDWVGGQLQDGRYCTQSSHYWGADDIEGLVFYAVPDCATEGDQGIVDESNSNNYHFYFTLPSTTDGQLVQIDLVISYYPSDSSYAAATIYYSLVAAE